MAATTTTIYESTIGSVATNNGVTLQQSLAVTKSATQVNNVLLENSHPSTATIAKSIKLITYFGGNVNNNNIAVEKYIIKPNFTGLIQCPGPQKGIMYLQIPNSPYALKFYAPDEYNMQYYNMVYCIPAIQNSGYLTGYQDYSTSVPEAFITAFVKYASTLPKNTSDKTTSAVPVSDTTKTIDATEATQSVLFSFNFWGNLSGVLGKSAAFFFEFVYYPGKTPAVTI